jgi:demethylmenaquinone methyltransferase/2-methoxy-6-polyprenyl-1,4-benzoquinol methylase
VSEVNLDPELVRYYSARAAEYEQIYQRPERRSDLRTLRGRLRELVAGERVLELACGTGYWTEVMADTAESIHAIDASEPAIVIAHGKGLPSDRVSLEVGDLFALEVLPGEYSTVVAGFWWSHVPRQETSTFLRYLGQKLGPGAGAVFFDNRFVAGSSSPVARADEHGDSYQQRILSSGEESEVLKNFPTREELLDTVRPVAGPGTVEELEYFWLLRFSFESGYG